MTPEETRLKARGFDGLYHPDPSMQCGCFIGDLRPCGETGTGCRGGHADGDGVYRPSRKRRDVDGGNHKPSPAAEPGKSK